MVATTSTRYSFRVPKKLYPVGRAKSSRRWRVEWRGSQGHVVHGWYRTKLVAIMDAYWRMFVSAEWQGEIFLFDQKKCE